MARQIDIDKAAGIKRGAHGRRQSVVPDKTTKKVLYVGRRTPVLIKYFTLKAIRRYLCKECWFEFKQMSEDEVIPSFCPMCGCHWEEKRYVPNWKRMDKYEVMD